VRASDSDPTLATFATLTESFCSWIANADSRSPNDLLNAVHRLLPQLYAAALQLPSTSALFDDDESSDGLTETAPARNATQPQRELPGGLLTLAESLGDRRFYREIFDPYSAPTEAEVTGDIIDDLGDIHCDLTAGLFHWRQGNTGEALWAWRFNFEIHWGEHATSALRAIFALSAWRDVPWPTGAG
jgi:Domain of unknown function (DUF5063)